MADLFQNPDPETALQADALSTAQTHPSWRKVVGDFLQSSSGAQLHRFLHTRSQAGAVIYPPQPFKALTLTPLEKVRVLILGQDPYHGAGQAEGLAFSVQRGAKIPPSLRNIFKERQRDLGLPIPAHGSLAAWAEQGILLLNTTLTVEQGQPASHIKQGWQQLTDAIIQACAQQSRSQVFMLWGRHAQAKQGLIDAHNSDQRHLILKAQHPCPLSALRPPQPFIGCGHFSAARQWLQAHSSDSDSDPHANAADLFI
jgi:uracil-DNA glycosylase